MNLSVCDAFLLTATRRLTVCITKSVTDTVKTLLAAVEYLSVATAGDASTGSPTVFVPIILVFGPALSRRSHRPHWSLESFLQKAMGDAVISGYRHAAALILHFPGASVEAGQNSTVCGRVR